MSSWFDSPLVATAVPVIVAAFGSAWLAQRWEGRRTARLDKERLRDAKANRLRRLYPPLVEFSQTLVQVVREKSWVAAGGTQQDRDARHAQMIEEAEAKVQKVAGALLIEPSTAPVQEAYKNAIGASQHYLQMLNMNAYGASIGAEEFDRQGELVASTAEELHKTVVAQMESLERPL